MNPIAEAFHRVLGHLMRIKNKSGPYWNDEAGGYWDRNQMEEDRRVLSRLIDMKTPWADEETLEEGYEPP